jgi:hypothetical protein
LGAKVEPPIARAESINWDKLSKLFVPAVEELTVITNKKLIEIRNLMTKADILLAPYPYNEDGTYFHIIGRILHKMNKRE